MNPSINQQRISRIASLPLKPLMVLPVLETQINYQFLTECFSSGYPTLKSYNFIVKIQMTISVLKRCLVFKTLFYPYTRDKKLKLFLYPVCKCTRVLLF